MKKFLQQQGVSACLISAVDEFNVKYPCPDQYLGRIPVPEYRYYGRDVWEKAISAIVSGENILLEGPKASGKNVLADNLCRLFSRPEWNISFYLNIDSSSLIGTDTFYDGSVHFRKGPVYSCAEAGGFGVLDEINMAKNESLAVLHAMLDYRRIIDVPGYDRITLRPESRFIATMNYGYAGTREINEALASRFCIIEMPVISSDNLMLLIKDSFPDINPTYAESFSRLFEEIRLKCEKGEISSKALDLRGLLSSLKLIRSGLTAGQALELGIVNKSFDIFEKSLINDVINTRIDTKLTAAELFG